MTITKSNHCVYDTHYHLVFPLKYRKALLSAEVVFTMRDAMRGIEERYDLNIEQFGDDKNHIHILVSFHPKYSIGQVVRIFKSITAKRVFAEHPALKKDLWGGEFWSDGYYASTVGTGGNWAVVEKYVKNQGKNRVIGKNVLVFAPQSVYKDTNSRVLLGAHLSCLYAA